MRYGWCVLLLAACTSSQEAAKSKGPPLMAPAHVCDGKGDDGVACDDGDPCTANDVCLAGSCAGAKTGIQFGGDKLDEVFAVAAAPGGGFALAGYTRSSGQGLTDLWLVRTGTDGKLMWWQTFGGDKSDKAYSILPLPDGYFLTGVRDGDVNDEGARAWLLRTDLNGNEIWNHPYGSVGSSIAEAAVRTASGFVVAGAVTAPGHTPQLDLVSVNDKGKLQWDIPIGADGIEQGAHALAGLKDGYAAAGFSAKAGSADGLLVRTDLNGSVLWQKTYGGAVQDVFYGMAATADGGFALTGFTTSKGNGAADLWVVRTDAAGTLLWEKTYGGPGGDEGRAIVEVAGGFALAGATGGSTSGGESQTWLLKLGSSGAFLDEGRYGTPGSESAGMDLLPLSDGGFVLVGNHADAAGLPYDAWMVRTDKQGNSSCQ